MRWLVAIANSALIGGAVLGFPGVGSAAEFRFERLVDTSTTAPGRISDFAALTDPALDGDAIAFAAIAGSPGVWAVADGELRLVASSESSVGSELDGFYSVTNPSLANGRVAFIGTTLQLRREGIYLENGEELGRLIGVAEGPDPGFRAFNQVWLAPTGVAFRAVWSDPTANDTIWAGAAGSVERWLDQETELPGALGKTRAFGQVAFDANAAYVIARREDGQGLYRVRDGAVEVIADSTMSVPGKQSSFTSFRALSARGNTVAFVARDADNASGVYAWIDHQLIQIATKGTTLPESEISLESFRAVAADAGRVAFIASGRGSAESLVLWENGNLHQVAATGDDLDGESARSFGLSPQALSGKSLAFQVELENAKQALYLSLHTSD